MQPAKIEVSIYGCRTLIATEETLLHPSRNPHLTREQIEDELKEFLGLEKVIWLWKGMAGDDAVRIQWT